MTKFWVFLGIAVVLTLFVALVATINWYGFKNGCSAYLKLAGDAPNIEKADEFLGKALEYIEENELTRGNSAILFKTPDADLRIWYEQLLGAKRTTEDVLESLRKDPASIDQLTRDNALMKLREVVLDEGSDGTEVTLPANISWYPYHYAITLMWCLVIALWIVVIVVMIRLGV